MKLAEPARARSHTSLAALDSGAMHLVEHDVILLSDRSERSPDGRHVAPRYGLHQRFAALAPQAQRDEDIAVALAWRLAHDAAQRLDDIDMAFALMHESCEVGIGHVDALGQAPCAGKRALRRSTVLVEQAGALPGR